MTKGQAQRSRRRPKDEKRGLSRWEWWDVEPLRQKKNLPPLTPIHFYLGGLPTTWVGFGLVLLKIGLNQGSEMISFAWSRLEAFITLSTSTCHLRVSCARWLLISSALTSESAPWSTPGQSKLTYSWHRLWTTKLQTERGKGDMDNGIWHLSSILEPDTFDNPNGRCVIEGSEIEGTLKIALCLVTLLKMRLLKVVMNLSLVRSFCRQSWELFFPTFFPSPKDVLCEVTKKQNKLLCQATTSTSTGGMQM